MKLLSRWHVWLGWLIGVPLLLWTASGLFMAFWPLETVRGEGVLAISERFNPAELVMPKAWSVSRLELVQEARRPVWVATMGDGSLGRFDARSGAALPAVDAAEARAIAFKQLWGTATVEGLTRFDAHRAPLDLRRERPSWQVRYTDGTHLYIDAETGKILALRTPLWRAYDFMWGLHIMDLEGRENAHHPVLIGFAGLAFLGSLLGFVLLFRRRKRG